KLDPEEVLYTLQGDKKVKDGKLRFVIPTGIGNVEIKNDVSREEIRKCLSALS
ncbi:MAG: 3-dehydroquinate synthase, partial [Cyanobacteriota bacterium]|nr:3-dehydroquinate synthase [Cyanobacteriota bacterium]